MGHRTWPLESCHGAMPQLTTWPWSGHLPCGSCFLLCENEGHPDRPADMGPQGRSVHISEHGQYFLSAWGKVAEVAVALPLPSPSPCFFYTHCRQEHCKPSHSITESHYGGPSPPYIANHKLAAPEPGRSLPVGERASLVVIALQGDPRNLH